MIGDVLPKSQEAKRLDAKETGGGGVGEEIGNHSVRFNEDTNTVTEDPRFYGYNILGGRDNSLTNSIKTIIDGAQNSGADVTECVISGEQNTVSRANKSIISGLRNNVTDDDEGIVTGQDNTTNGNSNTVTTGSENTVSNCQNCNISGNNNTARYATNSIVTGYNNTATSRDSITAGSGNTADRERAITAGLGNKAVSDGLTVGRYSQYNSNNRIVIGNGNDDNNRSNAFYVMYDGTTYAKVYNTTGADYAEYFEWADGNPDGEDRRGLLVQLIGDKIAAAHGDEILGAVSCRASVIGNAYEEHWHGKYKTDVFGVYIPDKDGRPQLSDDYDPNREYIPRSQRQEWAAIGLVGRLIICDNGKCEPGGYVTARQGVGAPTFTETRARCIRRLDGSHIEIIVR